MYNKIKDIILKSKELKNSGTSDLDIAKFIHIELGKIVVFNNNYTGKIEKTILDKQGKKVNLVTEMSRKRKINLLQNPTDISSKEQICKGLAEIYAAILTEVGIKAKVIGVEGQGVLGESTREDGTKIDILESYETKLTDTEIEKSNYKKNNSTPLNHYYTVFKTDQGEYIQDLLMEKSIARIKSGEVKNKGDIPGIFNKDDYCERVKTPFNNIDEEFILSLKSKLAEYTKGKEIIGINEKIGFVFHELNSIADKCGFEEAKDFISIYLKILLSNEEKQLCINRSRSAVLVKETNDSCKIACIYNFGGNNYLVKSGINSDIDFNIGKIEEKNIKKILSKGYSCRTQLDRESLDKIIKEKEINDDRSL